MTRHVVLAGGGHAHLAVLADWIRRPLPGARCTLIAPSARSPYSGMLPGWIAGLYRTDDLFIDLAPLARRAGVHLIVDAVAALDADRRELALAGGERIGFDLLSLATGGVSAAAPLAALGPRLIPVRPVPEFVTAWSAFLARAASLPAASLVVVGGGAAGVELALGASAALARVCPSAQVALVAPPGALLAGHAPRVRRLARRELVRRGIAVHAGQAVGTAEGVRINGGALLPADAVIAATGSRAQAWLAQSGLMLDPAGFVAVGADLRSVSHPAIFAAGDIVGRIDRPLERSGVHAVKAGPVLAANLRAALGGGSLAQYQPRRRTLYLLATGDRRAILSWGALAVKARWAWRLKDWIDRGFVGRYAARPPASA